jgi:hypothetical protein
MSFLRNGCRRSAPMRSPARESAGAILCLRGLSLEEACVRGMSVVWALEVGRGGAGSAKHLPSHRLQGLYGRLQRSVLAHQVKGLR